MKLLLCSDFSGVGYRYLKKFNIDLKNKNCLFIGYATEDEDVGSSAYERLKEFGLNIICFDENYDFKDKIDIIFVRGGNTTRLIHFLRKYNQFDKVKQLIKDGTIYVGNSAGAILVGSDSEWTLESEPYEVDVKKEFGKDALKCFNFINKLIFVHCTKYRLARDYEKENENDLFRTLDLDCYPAYLNDLKKYKKDEFIRIGNNQVYYVNDETQKIITYDWRKIPIKIVNIQD